MEEADAALTALAENWNQKVRAARKAGDISTILSEAQAAVSALEAAIGPRAVPGKAQISALKNLRKITYNSAADVYPGWEVDTPLRTPAQFAAGDAAVAKIASLDDKHKEGIKDQLVVARQVYGPPAG